MTAIPAALEFQDVTRAFGSAGRRDVVAIQDISFSVRPREFVAIVGPSGCGKSTILNLTAGLDRPSHGTVSVNGTPVAGPNSHVGFMLQKDLLLPWRSIVRNVEFGLEARNVPKPERRTLPADAAGHARRRWLSRFSGRRFDSAHLHHWRPKVALRP